MAVFDAKLKCTQSRKNGKCNLQGYELTEIPPQLLAPFDNLEGYRVFPLSEATHRDLLSIIYAACLQA